MIISTDATVIDAPANAENVPVFLGGVSCTGSEQYFNECRHYTPPTGGCSRAAISCGKLSECMCSYQLTLRVCCLHINLHKLLPRQILFVQALKTQQIKQDVLSKVQRCLPHLVTATGAKYTAPHTIFHLNISLFFSVTEVVLRTLQKLSYAMV